MKNFSLVLLIVVVFVLSSCQPKEKTAPATKQSVSQEVSTTNMASGLKIAFVNTDSFMERYFYVQILKKDLEDETNAKMATLQKKQKSYEKDAAYFQKQLDAGSISEANAQPIYQKLMERQQKLYELNQTYSNQLSQKEAVMNGRIADSLQNFINILNRDNQYDLILTKNMMTNILYANPAFDITDTVINGLNARYHEEEKK
jgi:outer membrane protein